MSSGVHRTASVFVLATAALAFFNGLPAYASPAGAGALPSSVWGNPLGEDNPGEAPPLVVMADLNRDGIPDMVEARVPAGDGTAPGFLTISLGQKDGSFKEITSGAVLGHDPRAMAAGDFNGDGVPDVIVGDGGGALTEFLGDGKGSLVPAGEIAHFGAVVSVAVADFNHDGMLDIAVSDSHSGSVTVLLGAGGGAFRHAWSFRLPMPGAIYRLAAADFNRDGLPDLVVTNEEGDAFEVMLGNGNGTFTSSAELSHLKDPNAHCVT